MYKRTNLALLLAVIGQYSFAQNIVFLPTKSRQDAQSILSFATGGEWVYTLQDPFQAPPVSSPVLIGRPKRQTYDLLSAQEQDQVDKYVQEHLLRQQRAQEQTIKEQEKELRKARLMASTHGAPRKSTKIPLDLDLPQILREEAGIVCVPRLDHAGVADWKDHLVCASNAKNEAKTK